MSARIPVSGGVSVGAVDVCSGCIRYVRHVQCSKEYSAVIDGFYLVLAQVGSQDDVHDISVVYAGWIFARWPNYLER